MVVVARTRVRSNDRTPALLLLYRTTTVSCTTVVSIEAKHETRTLSPAALPFLTRERRLMQRALAQPEEAPQQPPHATTLLAELFQRWGLDPALRRYHGQLGIENLYPWQARCLAEPGVVDGTRDLLYFAPTSGGKTMPAEIVSLLRVVGLPAASKSGGKSGEAGDRAAVVPSQGTELKYNSNIVLIVEQHY